MPYFPGPLSVREVADLVRSRPTTFLFGAALSKAAGFPLFDELRDVYLRAAAGEVSELLDLQAFVKHADRPVAPEEMFEVLINQVGTHVLEPLSTFAMGEPATEHMDACLIANSIGAPVITTNFDDLLEKARERLSRSVHVIPVHGSATDMNSLRVAVRQVSYFNAETVRRLAGEFVHGRQVLVAGYGGGDSDLFPLFNTAASLVWLFRRSTWVPSGLPTRYSRLREIGAPIFACTGDIGPFLATLRSELGLPTVLGEPIPVDWQGAVERWGRSLHGTQRFEAIGALLRHARQLPEARRCYVALCGDGRRESDLPKQGVALVGLLKVEGPLAGDAPAARAALSELGRLARFPSVRREVSVLSVVLNALESGIVATDAGELRAFWRFLLPPWRIPRDWRGASGRFARLLDQDARRCIHRGRYGRARITLAFARFVFRRLGDFGGLTTALWSSALLELAVQDLSATQRFLISIPEIDYRFIGNSFRFWINWLRAEVLRLLGDAGVAVEALENTDFGPINPDQLFWRNISLVSALRGMTPPDRGRIDDLLTEAEAIARTSYPESARAEVYVSIERSLAALERNTVSNDTFEELVRLERRCEAEGFGLGRSYVVLLRAILGDPGLEIEALARVAVSRQFPWSRACAIRLLAERGFEPRSSLSGASILMARSALRRELCRRGWPHQLAWFDLGTRVTWEALQFP